MSLQYSQPVSYIAIAKAVGIILMVMGHACATRNIGGKSEWQIQLNSFIYFFHMPLFFFLSGYFFKCKYLDKKIIFIKKKIQGLYIPYIKWVLFFAVAHNVFYTLGMYGATADWTPAAYSFVEIIRNCIAGLCFRGGDQLIGGFWFIPVLFFSALYSLLTLYWIRSWFEMVSIWADEKYKIKITPPQVSQLFNIQVYTIISIVLYLVLSCLLITFVGGFNSYYLSPRTCLATAFFLTGFFFNQNETVLKKATMPFVMLSFIVLYMALHVHKVSMGTLSYWYEIPYYYILGIIGTWMVIQSCRLLEGKENTFVNALIYVGEHTFIILALHFSCFKLINLFKIKYYGLVEQPYGSYPIIANDPSENSIVWFGLYIISGVVLPLIIERIFRMIKYNYE